MACWTFRDGSTIEAAPPAYRLALADGTPVEEFVEFAPAGDWADVLEELVDFMRYYAGGCDHDDDCPFSLQPDETEGD
jgi:hypothetical protein